MAAGLRSLELCQRGRRAHGVRQRPARPAPARSVARVPDPLPGALADRDHPLGDGGRRRAARAAERARRRRAGRARRSAGRGRQSAPRSRPAARPGRAPVADHEGGRAAPELSARGMAAGRLALFVAAGLALGFILLPLVLVSWLSFFRDEVVVFPPSGYTLRWFRAILDQRNFVDGFVTSLQVGVFADAGRSRPGRAGEPRACARYRFRGRESARPLAADAAASSRAWWRARRSTCSRSRRRS